MPNTSNYQFLNYHAHLFFEPLRLCSLTLVFFVFYTHPTMHIFSTICNTLSHNLQHIITQQFIRMNNEYFDTKL